MADKRIQQYPDKNNPSSSDYILIADSQDIDVNGFRKYKKIKISALDNIVITNAEDIERQDLIQLLNDNEAVIGRFYRITDSQIGEPILVQAVALNIISEMSVSGDDGIVYFYDIITDTRTNIQHVEINGTGFVKANGTTITYDNSTYLTNINGITAGGELSGTYPNPSLSNNAVTGKVLTGLSISGSSITSTDSILTSLGKLQNQINSLVGGVKYQGTWNASTNTPTLVSSVGTNGFYYVVDVAGSTNLNGITDWKVGDWAIFNGTTWQKVDNTDSVISVNGYTGAVTLTTSDIAEGTNLYYTDARVRQAISENIVGINYDNNTGVFSLASGYVIPTTTEQSNWNTAYNSRISSLTTVGNSGAATLVSNTLNIPNYTLGGLGGVPYTGATANVDLGEFGIKAGYFGYDLTPTNTPTTQGTTYWDSTEETVALIMNGAIQHVGLDTFYNVKNGTGSTIPKGTAVRFDGTDGGSGHLLIAPMLANGFYPSTYYMGITAEDIGSGDFGKVMEFGKLRGINTNSYTNGDILYVSTSSAGGFQTTVPTAPNNIIIAAAVVRASNNGTLMVRATLGSNINSDEGVKITSPTTGQLLQLQSNGLWENKTKAQVLGGTSSQFVKGDGSLDSTSYQPLDSDLTAIAGLSGDGLLRKTSGTWGMDTNTYLTANQTITISGEASGSGATSITLSLDNNSVTGKVLNGLSISGGSVVSTDSILVGIGKLQNQVNALAGGVNYQGTWNASTNTPSLTSSVGVKGYYYVVSVAGSTNLDGITDWKLGDWAIFNGSTWQKVDNTDAVISVNGYTGAVTLTKSDVGLGNVENTALSTWAGSTNITTLGTIGTGVWNGTAIGDSYISSASTWNAKIGGSGTTGKLAKFTSSGAVGDSIVTETTNRIKVQGQVVVDSTTGTASYFLAQVNNSNIGIIGSDAAIFGGTATNLGIFVYGNNSLEFSTNSTKRLIISGNGNASFSSSLTTGGNIIVNNGVDRFTAGTNGIVQWNPGGVGGLLTWDTGRAIVAANSTNALSFVTNGNERMRIVSGGNVLINTTTDNGVDKLQVNGSAKLNNYLAIASASPYIELTDTTNNIVHYLEGNDTSLVLYSDFGNTQSGSLIDFRIDGNTSRMSLSATELITFGATDTGESHIFGGSARVNGDLKVSGYIFDTSNSEILAGADAGGFYFAAGSISPTIPIYIGGANTTFTSFASNVLIGTTTNNGVDKLQVNGSARVDGALTVRGSGNSIVDSANSFALSIGASSANPSFVAIGTSGSGVPQINGYNNAFSATTSLALQPNGSNVLIGTTTDNGTDKLQVSGSLKVTGASTFGVFNANTPAIFTTNNTASTPAITAFKNTEDGNADVLLIQSYFGGTGIVDVARIKANGAATFSSSITWGSASGQYMYAGGASHIFAYSNSTSNYLYSGGSGGFNINNAADSVVLMRVTDAGNVGIGTTSPAYKLDVNGAIAIGNAVTTSVSTPSTHKVEIVIGGVTYYLLATT